MATNRDDCYNTGEILESLTLKKWSKATNAIPTKRSWSCNFFDMGKIEESKILSFHKNDKQRENRN